MLRQSVYSRLAGYEDTNDALGLARDPAMQAVVGRRALEKQAASTNTLSRFETEVLVTEENQKGLEQLNAAWVDRAMMRTRHQRVILDMDSSESPVYGEQEGAAYNGHFQSVCYHPLFLFNHFGDCEGALLRAGNVHSADRWQEVLAPAVERYQRKGVRLLFRGDAAFAKPEMYEYLESRVIEYAIRLPANDILEQEIKHLLKRPEGELPEKPVILYHDFQYQAKSWNRPRRVVTKVEWHRGELFPRVGFIVTNLSAKAKGVVHFYNGRGTAEQWIKEGKYARTGPGSPATGSWPIRCGFNYSSWPYNLGNFLRRLGLPKAIKDWSLRSLQVKLIKMVGRIVRHARQIVFQLAEVAVSREMFAAILERISRLSLASG